jgi:hypothetical protein
MTRFRKVSAVSLGCVLACVIAPLSAQPTTTRQIPAAGTATFTNSSQGFNTNGPELDPALSTDADSGNDATGRVAINRSVAKPGKVGNVQAPGQQRGKSNPVIDQSIDGLNFFQERFADNGNQFSVEPPDQGLCAGAGFVVESTNDVLRVFNTNGTAAGGVVSLNQFYGYPSAINRSTGVDGPEVTDPSCIFDPQTQRFFHLILTLDRRGGTPVSAGNALSGTNHLDLAVSQTSNPLGNWTIYRIPVQDDGTQGTPNHHCPGGPCLGDYPHIGTDSNGIYLTTNEFPFFAGGFIGAQIYAISKQALVSGASSINVVQYNTADASTQTASGLPGFTVWPAQSAGPSPAEFAGTEYFLSSLAVFADSGVSNQLQFWSLTNTSDLNSGGAPTLTSSLVNTEAYGIPGLARQPGVGTNGVGQAPGGGDINWPLGQCLNDPTCSPLVLGAADRFSEVISPLAGNDSRMQQVYYANGKLWASLGTGISFSSTSFSDGLAFFVLHPQPAGGTPTATVDRQGFLADPNVDYTYGTVAVTQSGRGVISFTATGPSNYPSVGYASLDDKIGVGEPSVAAAGLGPQDGFTGYRGFANPPRNIPRPRWGDYGAASVDGNSIWFSQEYIGQNCTLAQYLASSPFGSCSATRASLGNWGTQIVQVTP